MCFFKDYKTFLYSLFHDIKYICFLGYPEGICSPIFITEEFSGLFPHPSIFLIKDSKTMKTIQAKKITLIVPCNNANIQFTEK